MSDLSVTVLGCDGSYPGPGGACSGYLFRCGATSVWVDAGPGTLANLQRHIDIEAIDAVVVTHEHVDHWSDLEHLAVACKWVVPRPPVPVFSEVDIRSKMRTPATEAFDWCPIGPDSKVRVGEIGFLFSRTDHPVATLAVRAEGDGGAVGYSADSGPGWGLSELGGGLDLALCEATFLSDMEGQLIHMSARQAGTTAREAGVDRLVLIHLWPRIDRQAAQAEAESVFPGKVTVAATGDVYRL